MEQDLVKKVVVTGGAGFIGSHLADELAKQGYLVIIVDDLSIGSRENIKQLLDKDNVKFIQGSLLSGVGLLHGTSGYLSQSWSRFFPHLRKRRCCFPRLCLRCQARYFLKRGHTARNGYA